MFQLTLSYLFNKPDNNFLIKSWEDCDLENSNACMINPSSLPHPGIGALNKEKGGRSYTTNKHFGQRSHYSRLEFERILKIESKYNCVFGNFLKLELALGNLFSDILQAQSRSSQSYKNSWRFEATGVRRYF